MNCPLVPTTSERGSPSVLRGSEAIKTPSPLVSAAHRMTQRRVRSHSRYEPTHRQITVETVLFTKQTILSLYAPPVGLHVYCQHASRGAPRSRSTSRRSSPMPTPALPHARAPAADTTRPCWKLTATHSAANDAKTFPLLTGMGCAEMDKTNSHCAARQSTDAHSFRFVPG